MRKIDTNQTILEFIDNDIKHYKEILICNRDDEHIQTYYTHRLNYYNKLKEIVTIYNAIKTKPYKPLKEKDYIQELIDKETPKKLKSKTDKDGRLLWICPNCGDVYMKFWSEVETITCRKYCDECGQKLDWSDK